MTIVQGLVAVAFCYFVLKLIWPSLTKEFPRLKSKRNRLRKTLTSIEYNPLSTFDDFRVDIDDEGDDPLEDDHDKAMKAFDRRLAKDLRLDDDDIDLEESMVVYEEDTVEMLVDYLHRATKNGDCPWEGEKSMMNKTVISCVMNWKNSKDAKITLSKTWRRTFTAVEIKFQYPFPYTGGGDGILKLRSKSTENKSYLRLFSAANRYKSTRTSMLDMKELRNDIKERSQSKKYAVADAEQEEPW